MRDTQVAVGDWSLPSLSTTAVPATASEPALGATLGRPNSAFHLGTPSKGEGLAVPASGRADACARHNAVTQAVA